LIIDPVLEKVKRQLDLNLIKAVDIEGGVDAWKKAAGPLAG